MPLPITQRDALVGNDWQGLETKLDNTGFVLATVNFRPSLAQ